MGTVPKLVGVDVGSRVGLIPVTTTGTAGHTSPSSKPTPQTCIMCRRRWRVVLSHLVLFALFLLIDILPLAYAYPKKVSELPLYIHINTQKRLPNRFECELLLA